MRPDGGPRPHLPHRLGRRAARAAGRRQDGAGSGGGVGGGGEAAPRGQLRLRDRRRGHEDAVLHAERRRQEQAGLHAVGVQRRHRHLRREDRAQAARQLRAAGAGRLRRLQPAQDQLEVRHLRRGRLQHAGEVRRAGRRDPRQPVRGGGLPEPRHAHQGQHADARRAAARRAEPVLQGAAGSLAPPPRQAVEGAQDRRRPGHRDPDPEGGGVLRLPRLHRDRAGRAGRRRLLRQGEARLVDREGPVGGEVQGRRQGPGQGQERSGWLRPAIRREATGGRQEGVFGRRCWWVATSAAPLPRQWCFPRNASCCSTATRLPTATRSRTRRRCSASCARRGSSTSPAWP